MDVDCSRDYVIGYDIAPADRKGRTYFGGPKAHEILATKCGKSGLTYLLPRA
jgi:uncharacterized OB-fold protein